MKTEILGWVLLVFGFVIVLSTAATWLLDARRSGWWMPWGHCSSLNGAEQASEELKKQAEKMDADLDQKQKTFGGARDEFDKKKDVLDAKSKSKRNRNFGICSRKGRNSLWNPKAS